MYRVESKKHHRWKDNRDMAIETAANGRCSLLTKETLESVLEYMKLNTH